MRAQEPVSAFSGEQCPGADPTSANTSNRLGPAVQGIKIKPQEIIPDGGIRALGSGVEAELGGLLPWRASLGRPLCVQAGWGWGRPAWRQGEGWDDL